MTHILNYQTIKLLVQKIGIETVFKQLIEEMTADYLNWDSFAHESRITAKSNNGVIELMPIYNQSHYAFKYVNGHPNNPQINLPAVCAFGCLADMSTGIPMLIADMTLLTAIRTAACSAMVYDKVRFNQGTINVAIIGTGAQSEFQITALNQLHPIKCCYYYDIDPEAMAKFNANLDNYPFNLKALDNPTEIPDSCDVIITATSCLSDWVLDLAKPTRKRVIIAIGGDSPNKVELHRQLIKDSTVIVEYLPQTSVEGEIKQAEPNQIIAIKDLVHGKNKPLNDTIIFDSVGFAIEDYSILKLCYKWIESNNESKFFDSIPDPKNLFNHSILS